MRFITTGLLTASLAIAAPASAQDVNVETWLQGVSNELSRIRVSHTMSTLLMRCCKADRDKVEETFQNARESIAKAQEAASLKPDRLCGQLTFLGLDLGFVRSRMAILRSRAIAQEESEPLIRRIEEYKDRVANLAEATRVKRAEFSC